MADDEYTAMAKQLLLTPDASAVPPTDMGPGARRASTGAPPVAAAKTDDELGIASPADYGKDMLGRQRTAPGGGGTAAVEAKRAADPVANDPLAQTVLTGVLGAGAGTLAAAGARALGAAPLAARVASSAVGGGTASATGGDNPLVGAGIGAAVPLVGAALSKFGQSLAQGAAERTGERVFREYGQAASGIPGKSKIQAKLVKIGPEKVGEVLQRYGVGSVANAGEARAATEGGLKQAGAKVGEALKTIDEVGSNESGKTEQPTLGTASVAINNARKELATGPKADAAAANAMFKISKEIWDANGGKSGAPLSATDLHALVSTLEQRGYAGLKPTPSEASAAVANRRAAAALDELLDQHVSRVAATSPEAAAAAKQLSAATADYKVLKTVQPIVDGNAVKERFAPTLGQRLADRPVATIKGGAAKVATFPLRAAGGVASGIDSALARLHAARVAGAVTPQVLQETLAAGVPASVMYHALGDRQNGAMAVQREAFAQ